MGGVGPDHLPGHGHCDSLSFEWWVDGVPIIVDAGTLSYVAGAPRAACRSTRAHNTIEIDAYEQHEMWAAFRVARRATVHARLDSNNVIEADLIPWHDGQIRVTRRFVFGATTVRVEDHATPIAELARLLGLHKETFAQEHARKPERKPPGGK